MLGRNLYFVSTALCFALVGCGGGSSDPDSTTDDNDDNNSNAPTVLTGAFVDSAVEGVSYSTPTQSGMTNAQGQFSYTAGEQVTFSIGATQLPTVVAATQVSPVDMAAGDPAVATNIARLLQSLDSDGNPDNGITISTTAAETAYSINFNVSVDEFENNTDVINLVANSGSTTTALISAEDAISHLNDTLGVASSGNGDDSNEDVQFTQTMLNRRTLIPFPISEALQPRSVTRFNSANDSFVIGTPGGTLSDGNFPWSIDASGLVTIDFESFESGTLFTLELEAVEGTTIVTQPTWQGNPDPIGRFTLSVPLFVGDFFGRTISVLASEGPSTFTFGTNGEAQFNGESGGVITPHPIDGVDIRRLSSEFHTEIVLASGTLDSGVVMKSDFRNNRMFQIEFFQTDGNNWNSLHRVTR